MAFFGSPNAFLGLDIGTSSLKLVELLDRRKRIELAAYAQANLPNLLIHPPGNEQDAIRRVGSVVSHMIDQAGVATDVVVAALPSSIVFTTVLTLPQIPEKEMDKAVHFAARDLVPADLDDMVLGWSRLGEEPHMDTDKEQKPETIPLRPADAKAMAGKQGFGGQGNQKPASGDQQVSTAQDNKIAKLSERSGQPIFVTAAPKEIVNRYIKLMEILNLELYALEVETIPLARALLSGSRDSGLIIDIGDRTTAFHIIDTGTPRVSQSIEYGGHTITDRLSQVLKVSREEAEQQKIRFGLSTEAPSSVHQAITSALENIIDPARQLLSLYASKFNRSLDKAVLIGGGANLRGLSAYWSQALNLKAIVGNPWNDLSYAKELEQKLTAIGPTYAVAAGLARRGLTDV